MENYRRLFSFLGYFLLTSCAARVECSRKVACEGSLLSIDCKDPNLIIRVSSANYGRTDVATCPGVHYSTDCRSWNSLDYVRDACENAKNCGVLASNSVFGDPCIGTNKYLEVNYECEPAEDLIRAIGCEEDLLQIECDAGSTIEVVEAIYGRLARAVCFKSVGTTSCRAQNTLAIVYFACNGNRRCSVLASNSLFGDPCPGTTKYLEISYRCKPDAKFSVAIVKP